MSGTHLDATEDMDVFLCSKAKVLEMLVAGKFCQALMLAPLWKYFATNK